MAKNFRDFLYDSQFGYYAFSETELQRTVWDLCSVALFSFLRLEMLVFLIFLCSLVSLFCNVIDLQCHTFLWIPKMAKCVFGKNCQTALYALARNGL